MVTPIENGSAAGKAETMYLIPPSRRSPFYQVAYLRSGKWTTISTKKKTRSQAKRFLETLENNIRLGFEPEGRLPEITLRDFKDEYLQRARIIYSEKYCDSIEYVLTKLIEELSGKILLAGITARQAENFLLKTYNRSHSLAYQYKRTLKAAFNKAISWGYLKENYFTKVKLPREVKKIPAFINEIQMQLIIDKTESRLMKDIFVTAFLTGLRRAELLNLTWKDIDLKSGLITVRNTEHFKTKNRKDRIIPVNQTVRGILKRRIPKAKIISLDDPVFSKFQGVRLNGNFICKQFKKSVRAAKLSEDIHFHTLRHSFASMLVQRGVPLYTVKELLGHQDISTTQIYSHIAAENLFDAVRILNSISKIG